MPNLPGQGPGYSGDGAFVLNEISVTHGDKRPLKFACAARLSHRPALRPPRRSTAKTARATLPGVGVRRVRGDQPGLGDRDRSAGEKAASRGKNRARRNALVITLGQHGWRRPGSRPFPPLLATTQPRSAANPSIAFRHAASVGRAEDSRLPSARPADQKMLADYYRLARARLGSASFTACRGTAGEDRL